MAAHETCPVPGKSEVAHAPHVSYSPSPMKRFDIHWASWIWRLAPATIRRDALMTGSQRGGEVPAVAMRVMLQSFRDSVVEEGFSSALIPWISRVARKLSHVESPSRQNRRSVRTPIPGSKQNVEVIIAGYSPLVKDRKRRDMRGGGGGTMT